MKESFRKPILAAIGGSDIFEIETVQELWSGYGTIKRYGVKDSSISTLIVKHVCAPNIPKHPRGWNSQFSHSRKVKSYQVEAAWYRSWSGHCDRDCYVARCYTLLSQDDEVMFALEDLDSSGYEKRTSTPSMAEIRVCLKWLAHFHASFIGRAPNELWETGTYWHLETRPEELDALEDEDLKRAATAIDQKLKDCSFQTIVHGDAKIANFCFSRDGREVAAVDFQYVGGGCGMKDVAYFVGSCLDEEECEKFEDELLDYYFQVLSDALKSKKKNVETEKLISEWRALYHTAWADFHRFLKGWSPDHWKINSYSERVTRDVLASL